MKTTLNAFASLLLAAMLGLYAGSVAAEDTLLTAEQTLAMENAQLAWQRARLLHPSAAQRQAERNHQVFIYVGVTDRDVEAAMDDSFDRMENFLFANVIVTDAQGRPQRDPGTGAIITEDDGCD